MCCELCPNYEGCTVDDKLQAGCCKKCPDYDVCYKDDSDKNDMAEDDY